ncbi:MAG: extracellular solute-binding protein [Treponema sp.]|jgi:multiple sugar transport system substrate-binding protein|nr:extracellular solute-binding protein [Treponema sp.]
MEILDRIKALPGRLWSIFPAPLKRSGLGRFLKRARNVSADKVLWIWAFLMIAGLFLFKLISGNLPGMGSSLVFAQHWEDELEGQTLTNLAAEFEAGNPGITVRVEKMSWEEIRAALEGGESAERRGRRIPPPDVFTIDPYALYEVEAFLAPPVEEEAAAGTGGAFPVISLINPLFYNIDLLQNAGFDRPPKNQTELLSYVQRIGQTNTGGGSAVYGAGIALGGTDPHSVSRQLLSWIWAAAGSPEGEFSFTSPEAVKALNFLYQLKQNLYPNPFGLSEAELLRAFGEGKVGMIIGSSADIRRLKPKQVRFGITTIPGPESYARKPVFPLTTWYAGISAASPHQEDARTFAAFLREKGETIAAAAYAVPGSGRRSRELSKSDPYYAKAFDMYEAGEMAREPYRRPGTARLPGIIRREVELMLNGARTPQQCAEAIQRGWEAPVP